MAYGSKKGAKPAVVFYAMLLEILLISFSKFSCTAYSRFSSGCIIRSSPGIRFTLIFTADK